MLPVYGSIDDAVKQHPNADVLINFASFRSAFDSSKKALECKTIRTVVIIAEGVPENDVKRLLVVARKNKKVIIGPATVGGVQAGALRMLDAIPEICKYSPGLVSTLDPPDTPSTKFNR